MEIISQQIYAQGFKQNRNKLFLLKIFFKSYVLEVLLNVQNGINGHDECYKKYYYLFFNDKLCFIQPAKFKNIFMIIKAIILILIKFKIKKKKLPS